MKMKMFREMKIIMANEIMKMCNNDVIMKIIES